MSDKLCCSQVIISFGLFLVFAFYPSGADAADTDYAALGQQQYIHSNFKEAAASFRLAIYKGSKSPSIWLLLGQSYDKGGEASAARQAYETVQKYFPGTPESIKAAEYLKSLPTPSSAAVQSTTKGSTAPLAKPEPRKPLVDRITVVPPQFSHPPVSSHTVGLVRDLVAGLPKTVYKILDQGNTAIFITPNLIDRFPKDVGFIHPTIGRYLSEELGRTYYRDVYICERHSTKPGTTELSAPEDDATLKDSTYTYLAHALDNCLEMPSKDEQFLQLYRQDAVGVDIEKEPILKPVMDINEGASNAFAALAATVMGSKNSTAQLASRYFPRTRAWIERRIQILSNK